MKSLTQLEIIEVLTRLKNENPIPVSDLDYTNDFTLLIAVLLSAQTTDKGVNKATEKLFQKFDTPQKMLTLGEDGLIDYIKTIGLYKTKAKNVMRLCEILIDQHEGNVPNTRDALEALPGVGRKTANVVLNIAFGHTTLAVDTHVFRISHRLGLSFGKTPLAVESDLMTVIPAEFLYDAHHWLILHGRYVCKAQKPGCDTCILVDLCPKNNT